MKLKILHKVFLALLLSTGAALAAMALLVQWNLGRGFLDYLNQVEATRLEDLAVHFAEQYQANGSNWDWTTNNRVWERLTFAGSGRQPPPSPRRPDMSSERPFERPRGDRPPPRNADRRMPPPDRFEPEGARETDRQGWRGRGGRGNRPPPPVGEPLAMAPRISLFDANGTHVMGHARSLTGERQRKAIKVGEETVGWLTVDPIKQVSAVRDVSFLRQQSWSFLGIAGALLAGAAMLAIVLARHLTRPLGAVTAAVQQLAEGDYGSRIVARGKDEITELSQNIDTLARTLDDNQHARQRWIADISHELRTPLAIMRGELEALQDGVRPVDSLTIDSLHGEIMRLGKLVSDLHELSLSDIGALTYQMLPIDLGEVLDEATDLFRQRLASRGLALEYSRDASEQWPISGDRQRLLQLFTNLLENSLRYTDTGGRIIIQLQRHGRKAVIEIADTKPTVSIAECGKLFDRLYRVDPSRTRAQGGSGLGLSICKNIADAHNAVIKAAPSTLGGLAVTLEIAMTGG